MQNISRVFKINDSDTLCDFKNWNNQYFITLILHVFDNEFMDFLAKIAKLHMNDQKYS